MELRVGEGLVDQVGLGGRQYRPKFLPQQCGGGGWKGGFEEVGKPGRLGRLRQSGRAEGENKSLRGRAGCESNGQGVAGEAEAYLDSTWGRRVRLPSIESAQLRGVGRLRAAGNTEIPVVLYTGEEEARIAAFVYSYALIDRLDDTATLNTQVRSQLAQRNRLVADGQAAGPGLLWRNRANIFVVVSPSLSPDALRARVQP